MKFLGKNSFLINRGLNLQNTGWFDAPNYYDPGWNFRSPNNGSWFECFCWWVLHLSSLVSFFTEVIKLIGTVQSRVRFFNKDLFVNYEISFIVAVTSIPKNLFYSRKTLTHYLGRARSLNLYFICYYYF